MRPLDFAALGLLISYWWIAAWLALIVAVTIMAVEKGRSGVGFFLLSLLFSPLLGWLVLSVAPDRAREARDAERHRRSLSVLDGFSRKLDDLHEMTRARRLSSSSGGGQSVLANPPSPTMGYCPGCGRLRASSVVKCVYCKNSDPVSESSSQGA